MPKRTNERQQIIEMVKAVAAGPDCTVTASKMLRDRVTGMEREVDVVVEHAIDEQVFTQSFEVTSTSRPVDVQWVEQQIKKHESLPTDRLFLVSWAGFTENARKKADVDPRVIAVVPTVEDGGDGPAIKSLFIDTVKLNAERVVCELDVPGRELQRVVVVTNHGVYSDDGALLGYMTQAVDAILTDPEAIQLALLEAHQHAEKENLKWFTLRRLLNDEQNFLHHEESDELHRIRAIEVSGSIEVSQAPIDLEVRSLGNQRFAHGKLEFVGSDGLIVAALDDCSDVTGLEVRFDAPPHAAS